MVGLSPKSGRGRKRGREEEREGKGKTPGYENASLPAEHPRHSPRKRVVEPGSPVPEGGVVHRRQELARP